MSQPPRPPYEPPYQPPHEPPYQPRHGPGAYGPEPQDTPYGTLPPGPGPSAPPYGPPGPQGEAPVPQAPGPQGGPPGPQAPAPPRGGPAHRMAPPQRSSRHRRRRRRPVRTRTASAALGVAVAGLPVWLTAPVWIHHVPGGVAFLVIAVFVVVPAALGLLALQQVRDSKAHAMSRPRAILALVLSGVWLLFALGLLFKGVTGA
jgi:hypothetical protein